MQPGLQKWFLFILLSLIWGSSFWLIERGMQSLNPYQVASLRIIAAALVLLPVTIKHIRSFDTSSLLFIFFTGLLGNLFPAYFFCIAETKIESSLAGTLNALTPVFAIVTGRLFFGLKNTASMIIGILIAFTGCLALFFSRPEVNLAIDYFYLLLIFFATFCYGFNVNLVRQKLMGISPLAVVSIALFLNAIPALIILLSQGTAIKGGFDQRLLESISATLVLGAVGTALANYLFYVLISQSGSVFAALVTYGIPFVALGWGIWDSEPVGAAHFLSLSVILAGVFIATRNPNQGKKT